MILLLQSLNSIIIGIDTGARKCLYHNATKDMPIQFNYIIHKNLNTKRQKLEKSEMSYSPTIALSIVNEQEEELKYLDLEPDLQSIEFVLFETAMVKACLKGLNDRQQYHMFGYEVWLSDENSKKAIEQLYKQEARNDRKTSIVDKNVKIVQNLLAIVRKPIDTEFISLQLKNYYILTSIFLIIFYIFLLIMQTRKIKHYLKQCKL